MTPPEDEATIPVSCLGGRDLGEALEYGPGWRRVDLIYATPDELFILPMLWHPEHGTMEVRTP